MRPVLIFVPRLDLLTYLYQGHDEVYHDVVSAEGRIGPNGVLPDDWPEDQTPSDVDFDPWAGHEQARERSQMFGGGPF